jgi:hypothetical protein
MGTLLKLFLVALLTLPTGAFVAGRLSAEQTDLDRPRPPVVLEDPTVSEPQETLTSRPRDPRADPDRPREPRPVEVIGPRPTDLDDDRDDQEEEQEGEQEDRGTRTGDSDETDEPETRGDDDGERDEDAPADDGERDQEDDELEDEPDDEPSEADDEPDDD